MASAVEMKLQPSLSGCHISGSRASCCSPTPLHLGPSHSPLTKSPSPSFLRNLPQESPHSVFSFHEFHLARLSERFLSFRAYCGNSLDGLDSQSASRRGSRSHGEANEISERKLLKRWKSNFPTVPADVGKRVLVAVQVLGSAGSLRFLVAENELVQRVIGMALQTYANQGRQPALGVDSEQFELYARCPDFQVLHKATCIGSLSGARQFVLYRKWGPHQKLTDFTLKEKQVSQNALVLLPEQHQPPARSLQDPTIARPVLCTILCNEPRQVAPVSTRENQKQLAAVSSRELRQSPAPFWELFRRQNNRTALRQSRPSDVLNWWAMLTAVV